MHASDEALRSETIERVAAEVRQRLDREAGPPAEAFARRFYAQTAIEDLRARPLNELAGAALALWSLARVRRPGEALVRVFDPDLAEHGWHGAHSVVEVVNDDMPFLVDSVTAALSERGLEVHLILHPIARLRRNQAGEVVGIADGDAEAAAAPAESLMYFEVDRIALAADREALRQEVLRVLALVRAAVEDWQPMQERLSEIVRELEEDPPPLAAEELAETVAFLDWLGQNNFTFLGYRDYDFVSRDGRDFLTAVAGSGLGILRDALRERPSQPRELSPEMSRFARRLDLVFVTKTNGRSKVHRPSHMDYVGIKRFDAAGKLLGERRFQGLFTSLSYRQLAEQVPLLRRKVRYVAETAGFSPSSHDGKALAHIVETFPRDELFQISEQELYETAMGVLRLAERKRIALFVRKDGFERFVACLVYVPKDRYDTDLRRRMEHILERAFQGRLGAAYTLVGEEPLARIQFFLSTVPGRVPEYDVLAIEEELARAARTWSDDLAHTLASERGEDKGMAAFNRYARAFPAAYREAFQPSDAGSDIDRVEQVLATGRLDIFFYKPIGAGESEASCKVYSSAETMPLSDVLPLFENLGFKVLAERPFEIEPAGAETTVWIRDFELATADAARLDLGEVREPLEAAFLATVTGEAENDAFNRLVLAARLPWRQVVVLRAYGRYLRQTGTAFSQETLAQALVRNAGVARLLVELFLESFDPDAPRDTSETDGAGERVEKLVAEIKAALDAVTNPSEDEILRRFLNLVKSSLRTNYFQHAPSGAPAEAGRAGEPKPYLSIKLDSRRVDELPKPRPMVEIFVYSPRVEAIHLRGGMVARGGIRWSDRPEDFRTEVLSLMKAQMVKNAVIVPVGAKGGFIVKRPPADRQALQEEGIACYKTLVRGLLDLTDNYQGTQVVPPPRVVRKDGDDPYLVVAADKGTATFSDIANALSAEYRHWLGDAFASGGSAGYDHKKMAITARGAWESVKRHFRELGRDTQEQDFTCVGVGDMAGDVFGNGMLQSRHIKLLAAFNHLHIFVDPGPDPEASFAERQRLFDLPRSTWRDYDPAKISAGGGVFDRGQKSIAVTPEMRRALGVEAETVTPAQLIRAILKADVDLLWFGGIGTYVKAADETHAQVNDRANDALRVDGAELSAKVIGEGANLGLTQRGRVEYALAGGRLNTDAIDNSGGVDCSDHEVNIKILLNEVVGGGDLTLKQRDQLLEQMTDEVAALVLRDNYLQTQAITVAESLGVAGLDRQVRLIRELERAGRLDRALEGLPDDEDLADRQRAGKSLTRPEIAILLAYSKITLYDALLASDLPDDALVAEDLFLYFPTPLRERFPEPIRAHRLRREIIATYVTNSMVNRVGPTFVNRVQSATGAAASEIAKAYALARDAFELRFLWAAIEALDNKAPAEAQTAMLHETKALVERATLWFLRRRGVDAAEAMAVFRPGVAALAANPDELLTGTDLAGLRRAQKRLEKQGVPEALAARVASLDMLASALDIIELAHQRQRSVEEVAKVYFQVGARFGFDWLREEADKLAADTPWQREAKATLVQELFDQQKAITGQVLSASPAGTSAKAAIDHWAEGREAVARRSRDQVAELKAAGSLDFAMLAVARHQLAGLVAG